MKRRLDHTDDNGSLELLLDTLCNVFGGIVLIACLLAIIPRHNTPPPLLPNQVAQSQMIERRISSAQDEIAKLESDIVKLSANTNPEIAELQSRRASLEKLRDKLQEDKQRNQEQEMDEAEARALTASGNVDQLKETLKEMQWKKSQTEGVDAATKQKIAFLEERQKRLNKEAASYSKGRIQAVRFPRERDAKGGPLPIIVRYNLVYPMALGNPLKSNPAIEETPLGNGDAVLAAPIAGKGIHDPEKSHLLMETLKAASRDETTYISVYLYSDSHEVFAGLRSALATSKIRYGLEFVKSTRELKFSSSGSAPPEL